MRLLRAKGTRGLFGDFLTVKAEGEVKRGEVSGNAALIGRVDLFLLAHGYHSISQFKGHSRG